MEFNKRPGPEIFSTKHKPGPPFSKELRKLDDDYARQQAGEGPVKAASPEAAEKQAAEIQNPVPEPADGSRSTIAVRTSWAIALAGGIIVFACAGLWILGRRR